MQNHNFHICYHNKLIGAKTLGRNPILMSPRMRLLKNILPEGARGSMGQVSNATLYDRRHYRPTDERNQFGQPPRRYDGILMFIHSLLQDITTYCKTLNSLMFAITQQTLIKYTNIWTSLTVCCDMSLCIAVSDIWAIFGFLVSQPMTNGWIISVLTASNPKKDLIVYCNRFLIILIMEAINLGFIHNLNNNTINIINTISK